MKVLLLIASYILTTTTSHAHQYINSIEPREAAQSHNHVFQDGELSRVLSKLIGQELESQSNNLNDYGDGGGDNGSSNIRGQIQEYGLPQQQQYGPPSGPIGNPLGPNSPPPEIQYGITHEQQGDLQLGPSLPERLQSQQQYNGVSYGPPLQPSDSSSSPLLNDNKQEQQKGTRSYSFSFSFGDRIRPRKKPERLQQQQFSNAAIMNDNNNNGVIRVPVTFNVEDLTTIPEQNQVNNNFPTSNPPPPPLPPQEDNQFFISNNLKIKDQRFVYIYAAPPEPFTQPQPQIIRQPQKQDTHYQIIFVKAPSAPVQPPTEIHMPLPPEQKTLVYVLVKKPEKQAEIRFSSPPTTTPSPPEVYFIKYRKTNQNQNLPSTSDENAITQLQQQVVSDDDEYGTEQIAEKLQAQSSFLGDPRSNVRNSKSFLRDNEISGGYQSQQQQEISGGYQKNNSPIKLLSSPRITFDPRSSISKISQTQQVRSGSHYTAPGAKPWVENSSKLKMFGDRLVKPSGNNGVLRQMRLTTSDYIPPSTSSGGYD